MESTAMQYRYTLIFLLSCRFWYNQLREYFLKRKKSYEEQALFQFLDNMKETVVEDRFFNLVANSTIMMTIKREMQQRLSQEKQSMVKAWLGLHQFCQQSSQIQVYDHFDNSFPQVCITLDNNKKKS